MSLAYLKTIGRFLGAVIFGSEAWARKLGVSIGRNCRIYIRSWGSEPFLIRLGDGVTVTSGVKFLTHDGATSLVRSDGTRYQRYGAIVVGDNVFIGVNSIIMPGVTIGSNVVVGAGSVVTRDIAAGTVVCGVPARTVSSFDDFAERVRSSCAIDSELIGTTHRERVERALAIQRERRP